MIPAGWRRRADILLALTRSDLRIRYGRGPWQVVNWLVNPFALVGVYVLLRVILGRQRRGSGAVAVVRGGAVPDRASRRWMSSISAVSLREPVLLNMRFDRMLIPASSVMTESVAFAASFLLFPITMIFYGVAPTPALLWLPVVIAATLVLALGLAWPAALLGLWLPTSKVFASAGPATAVLRRPEHRRPEQGRPDDVHDWIVFNPFTGLFESFRHVFLYGDSPGSGSSPIRSAWGLR